MAGLMGVEATVAQRPALTTRTPLTVSIDRAPLWVGDEHRHIVPARGLRFGQHLDVVFDPAQDGEIVFVDVQDAQGRTHAGHLAWPCRRWTG